MKGNCYKKTKDYESFFAMYKSKDIVYSSAVARYFGINIKAAYEVCENRLNKDLRKLYMIKCPVCNFTLPDRFYSIVDIDRENEYVCNNCDTVFKINLNKDIYVYYEKTKGDLL